MTVKKMLVLAGFAILTSLLVTIILVTFDIVWIYLVAAAPLGLLVAFKRQFNQVQLSPTIILAVAMTGCSIAGYGLRGLVASAVGKGASIDLHVSDAIAIRTVILITVSASSMVIASAVSQRLLRTSNRKLQVAPQERASHSFLYAAAIVPPLLAIVGNGPASYLSRSFYLLGEKGSFIGTVAVPLITASVLLTGYLFAVSSKGARGIVIMVALLNVSVLFSQSSRTFALAPLLFAIGFAVSGRPIRKSVFAAVAASCFLLLPLPLIFRGQPQQGLLPNLSTFFGLDPTKIDWMAPLNNILISFPIIAESAYGPHTIYFNDMLVSLNPLSGNLAGWPQVAARLRLNAFTPMAGLGEVGHHGLAVVVIFFGALGVAMAWFERSVIAGIEEQGYLYSAVLLGLIVLFATQLFQYNLRSGIRLLLYAAMFELSRRLFTNLREWLSTRQTSSMQNAPGSVGKF